MVSRFINAKLKLLNLYNLCDYILLVLLDIESENQTNEIQTNGNTNEIQTNKIQTNEIQTNEIQTNDNQIYESQTNENDFKVPEGKYL